MTETPISSPTRLILPAVALIVGISLGVAGAVVVLGQDEPSPEPTSVALEKQGDGLWAGLVECTEESITFDVRNENEWPVVVAARSNVWGVPTTFRVNWRFDAPPGLERVTLNLDEGEGVNTGAGSSEPRDIVPDDYLICSDIGIGYP